MKATRSPNRLLAIGMAIVLLLPYAAPSVCGMLGRIGGEMDMLHDVATVAVESPTSGDTCCTIDGCGIPHVAPPGCDVILLGELADTPDNLPAPSSADPTPLRFRLTPPPKA